MKPIKIKQVITILFLFVFTISFANKTEPPKPFGVVPSQSQLDWHEMEYFSLVCYGLNTYTEVEWAYGDVNPNLFTPIDLNTDQWAKVAKEAGMKGLILVAKHHDGFCLWPSKYNEYSVKATPWKNGNGDILGDLVESCKKFDLKLGVYLSPWDRNHADYGKLEYVQYYYNQLEELLTNYGDVFEFWIDGANGGTGYYGGADERRNIDRESYYGYETIFDIVKKHQPDAVIFSDVGPGSRWVGNESGIGGETNWNTINTNGKFPGEPSPEYHKKLAVGEPGGENWVPAEVNTTLLWPKAWYYHTGHQPRSTANLMDLYYTSIGRGSPLNLGLAIAPSGRIRDIDAEALLKFRKNIQREFEFNLMKAAKISADNYRGKSDIYNLEKIKDESTESYWATDDGVKNATLTIDFEKETTLNRLLLQEFIALGQRIHKFTFEIETKNGWKKVTEGTTIGYKRILKFDDVKATKARLIIETNAPCLTLSNLEIYNAPAFISEPIISCDKNGMITIDAEDDLTIYYKTKNSTSEFKKYAGPVSFSKGGKIQAYATQVNSNEKSDISILEIGIAKTKWKIHGVDSEVKGKGSSKKAIDGDAATSWVSKEKDANQAHYLSINLGEKVNISGFSYLPCAKGCEGIIYEYEFYTSLDGKNWGAPLQKGEFSNIQNNPVEQVIKFKNPIVSKYIKLVSKSAVKNSNITSVAEINIFSEN